jgi:hypothetical protein
MIAASKQQRRYVLIATQGVFFLSLLWCGLISHSHRAQVDGISFYGVHRTTIPILATGFVLAGAGLWLFSLEMPFPKWINYSLRAIAVSLVGLLLTPYTAGTLSNWVHMSVGVAGAVLELFIGIALLQRDRRSWSWLVFAVQLGAGLIAASSLPDWHFSYLLEGEFFYEVGFSLVLLRWYEILP